MFENMKILTTNALQWAGQRLFAQRTVNQLTETSKCSLNGQFLSWSLHCNISLYLRNCADPLTMFCQCTFTCSSLSGLECSCKEPSTWRSSRIRISKYWNIGYSWNMCNHKYDSAKINKQLILWVIWTGWAEARGESFWMIIKIKCC